MTTAASANYAAIGEAVWAYYRKRAIACVQRAVKDGDLPKPTDLQCVDCGGRAAIYEHRDYTKPLEVVPACDPCNHRRGCANLPIDVVIDHIRWSARFPRRRGSTSGAELAHARELLLAFRR